MARTLKSAAQGLLKRSGLYYRLKASRLYDLYWMLADRRVLEARDSEVTFYSACLQGLRHGDVIFDIGANEGYKTDIFLRLGARVVAVDPDEHNQETLRQGFLAYRLSKSRVVVVRKAVSDKDGRATLLVNAPGSAKNTLNQKWAELLRTDDARFGARLEFDSRQAVETVSLESLIDAYGVPFFVKIDVEGHEAEVVRGLRRPVPYLSFEVNLPEFRAEGEECIEMLGKIAPEGTFNYAVDCALGFTLEGWAGKQEFLRRFRECPHRSIEVFWRGIVR